MTMGHCVGRIAVAINKNTMSYCIAYILHINRSQLNWWYYMVKASAMSKCLTNSINKYKIVRCTLHEKPPSRTVLIKLKKMKSAHKLMIVDSLRWNFVRFCSYMCMFYSIHCIPQQIYGFLSFSQFLSYSTNEMSISSRVVKYYYVRCDRHSNTNVVCI